MVVPKAPSPHSDMLTELCRVHRASSPRWPAWRALACTIVNAWQRHARLHRTEHLEYIAHGMLGYMGTGVGADVWCGLLDSHHICLQQSTSCHSTPPPCTSPPCTPPPCTPPPCTPPPYMPVHAIAHMAPHHSIPHHSTPFHTTSPPPMLCNTTPHYSMQCYTTPFHIMACRDMPYNTILPHAP